MKFNMQTESQKEAFDWLALCYIAGELSDHDAEEFEASLADDQMAREALARAVELTQTVAAAEHQSRYIVPATKTATAWNARLSWMAVGGLASLLVAMFWSGIAGPAWQTARNRSSSASRQTLAQAWTETRTQLAHAREAGLWPGADLMNDGEGGFESGAIDGNETDLDDAPSWLMAAVLGQSVESDPSTESL